MSEPSPAPFVSAAAGPSSRRLFLKRAFKYGLGLSVLGSAYGLLEASYFRVLPQTVRVSRLPPAFAGLRVAFVTDIHHGPFTGLGFVRKIVRETLALQPDLIVLGGDYVHRDRSYIDPCFHELRALAAPLGVYGVLGNHDHWESASETRRAMARAGIGDLSNTGVWLTRGNARLRLGGVGDLWEDEQDLSQALGDANSAGAAVLLSHNPDYAEKLTDPRVSLMLSGHTHGGQCRIPFYGAPVLPSRYGRKYEQGLIQAPHTQVYVSRGLGTITPPLRFAAPPELTLLTLV